MSLFLYFFLLFDLSDNILFILANNWASLLISDIILKLEDSSIPFIIVLILLNVYIIDILCFGLLFKYCSKL